MRPIKQINEELTLVLNELSDDLKNRVFQKRKEQLAKAQDKLNRTAELLANTKTKGAKEEIKVTFLKGYVTTEEDSYEEGALGKSGSSWDNDKTEEHTYSITDVKAFVKQLAEDVGNYLYLYHVTSDDLMLGVDNNSLLLGGTVEVNNDNEEPTEQELADFKAGKLNLWLADIAINIRISDEDKPFFINALKEAKVNIDYV